MKTNKENSSLALRNLCEESLKKEEIKFTVSRPSFSPENTISFNLSLETVFDLVSICPDDNEPLEFIGELVKKDLIKFLKTQVSK